jgi:hypothetical protein
MRKCNKILIPKEGTVYEYMQAYVYSTFSVRGSHNLENVGLDVRIRTKWILHKQNGMAWSGMIWSRMGTRSGLLQT